MAIPKGWKKIGKNKWKNKLITATVYYYEGDYKGYYKGWIFNVTDHGKNNNPPILLTQTNIPTEEEALKIAFDYMKENPHSEAISNRSIWQ